MGCQRQLTVDDNTEIASGVRDGDVSAEPQDVMAVDLVQQVTLAEPQQLRLRRHIALLFHPKFEDVSLELDR